MYMIICCDYSQKHSGISIPGFVGTAMVVNLFHTMPNGAWITCYLPKTHLIINAIKYIDIGRCLSLAQVLATDHGINDETLHIVGILLDGFIKISLGLRHRG